jgi:riboflavin kinase/FMN adenylyltransferase
MKRFRDFRGLGAGDRGAAVAMGNFDGVHLGHQSVLGLAHAAAAELAAPFGVVTFEPHPRAFAETVLRDGLGLSHAVVGADFRFGKGRAGGAGDLRALGVELGFGVTVAELMDFSIGPHPVSSTLIREALSEGRPREARAMLGHWHRIEGPVIHGEKRGHDLGFPTANMALDGLHLPRFGVYAVLADVLDGPHAGSYHGVASLGVRPMFGVNTPNLEANLFDFRGDLYGAELSVGLVDYLRPEMRFDGLPGLTAQMHRDAAEARACLAAI